MVRRAACRSRRIRVLSFVVVFLLVGASAARAEDPATDFKKTCHGCHTIGGGVLQGPDLKDVAKRRERDWLLRFITDPGAVLDSGDPYAQQLLEDANNVRMPNVAGMTRSRAQGLLDLIDSESLLEKSRFVGLQLDMRPFTPEDVALGRSMFVGTTPLKNGGASCISCHTVGGLSVLGGGRLGPDLTRVYERHEDRRKLATWLSAPATETMLPTFADHPLDESELLPLVAYFDHTMQTEQEDASPRSLIFVLLGLGGAIGAILGLNWLWRRRFQGVRQSLVRNASIHAGESSNSV